MPYIKNSLAVLCGGACGAVCRVTLCSLFSGVSESPVPVVIVCINILGSLLLGILQGTLKRYKKAFDAWYCLLGTGFLGAFTTFSAVYLDIFVFYTNKMPFFACCTAFANVVLCLLAVWLGYTALAFPKRRLDN